MGVRGVERIVPHLIAFQLDWGVDWVRWVTRPR
jgi:hypothetical protein